MIYDLIVVGSGSVGAAAGYYATQAGLSVLMIDSAHPPHHQGAHHGESRLIRHAYGEGERYVPLVLRAQTLWDELEQQAGERIMHRCGVLNLAPVQSEFIQNVVSSAQTWQLLSRCCRRLTCASAGHSWRFLTDIWAFSNQTLAF